MFVQFYGEYTRKLVIAFGTLFNDIYVTHKEDNVDKNIRVPLTYAPKEKFIRRLLEESSITDDTKVGIRLPQMSFSISQIAVDGTRRRNKAYSEYYNDTAGGVSRMLVEVPINVNFNLFMYTRHINDTLQISEQIIPYFNPDHVLKINYNLLRQEMSVPLVMLNSININERYDGDFGNRRINISSIGFVAKGYMFGPVNAADTGDTMNAVNEFDLNINTL